MDEDLKQQLIGAIQDLRDGAPQAFEMLSAQVAGLGLGALLFGFTMLAATILAGASCRRHALASRGEDGHCAMAICTGIVTPVTGITCLVQFNAAMEMCCAPGVWLLTEAF